jgi:DNA-binding IclR family transcriptional regulator
MAADGDRFSFEVTADGRSAATPKDRQFVNSLARGFEILRAFAPNDTLLGNQEIAERTGLPKPTVSRLTYTLTRLGYLTYLDRLGKYQLGTSVLALGYAALASMGIRQIAKPHMQVLADFAGASIGLGSRDRLTVIYIEHASSEQAMTLRLDVGSRIPLGTTSMGRALLAALPEIERQWLMEHMARKEGGDWPRVRAGIERAIEDYRSRGFVMSLGEWQRDVNSVGVPLIPTDGGPILAFNCGAPAYQLSPKRLETELGPRLVNLVRNVEMTLGRA